MARKKFKRRVARVVILVVLASTPFWLNFRSIFSKISGLFRTESKKSALETSLKTPKPTKTGLLAGVSAFLKKEGALLPGAKPEIVGLLDLNNDGLWEIVVDTQSGGAYTTTFEVLEYKNGRLEWLKIIDKDGKIKKAEFVDGSSVRYANAFKIFNDERGKAYVQITGESDDTGTKWAWDVAAYSWNGKAFAYDRNISERIRSEDPQKIFQEEDYLNKLFKENQNGAN